ncbi:MAG TPA: pilus assembly PilX N-terminal domain-containing protein [Methylomirabilota bacterium]|nr:pilus assembly PilX N-terminal domain-containing protein [Methylomirabilota bacterium]
MTIHSRSSGCLGGERGMALPMTMIVLTLISTLTLAFMALAASEPIIASNHMASAQARAMAESGVERALWALSMGTTSPSTTGAVSDPLPSPVPAPYNGSQYVSVSANGGFVVTIANGAAANERLITAVGYVPNNVNPVAIKKIQLTATRMKWLDPPCAICAGGEAPTGMSTEIQIGGAATVRASTASGAQYCAGVMPTAATMSQGSINTNGSPNLTAPPGGVTQLANQPASAFSSFIFSDADMAMLKEMAKATGTYLQGSQTFTSPPPNGLIFIDTPSGNPFTASSPSSDIIMVDVHGNWSQSWSGWLVVAGSVYISGNVTMNGLIYAQNDVTMDGTGTGGVTGAVISTNRLDTNSTNVDAQSIGNAPTTYNCQKVRDGGGTISQRWFSKPGTFREVAGT